MSKSRRSLGSKSTSRSGRSDELALALCLAGDSSTVGPLADPPPPAPFSVAKPTEGETPAAADAACKPDEAAALEDGKTRGEDGRFDDGLTGE